MKYSNILARVKKTLSAASIFLMISGCHGTSLPFIVAPVVGGVLAPGLKDKTEETFLVKTYDAFDNALFKDNKRFNLTKKSEDSLTDMFGGVGQNMSSGIEGYREVLKVAWQVTTIDQPVKIRFRNHQIGAGTTGEYIDLGSMVAKGIFEGAVLRSYILKKNKEEKSRTGVDPHYDINHEFEDLAIKNLKELRAAAAKITGNIFSDTYSQVSEEEVFKWPIFSWMAIFAPLSYGSEVRELNESVSFVNQSFVEGVEFLVLHEAAHNLLGHYKDVGVGCVELRSREVAADELAVFLAMQIKNKERELPEADGVGTFLWGLGIRYLTWWAVAPNPEEHHLAIHRGSSIFFQDSYLRANFLDDECSHPTAVRRLQITSGLSRYWLEVIRLKKMLEKHMISRNDAMAKFDVYSSELKILFPQSYEAGKVILVN